MRLRLLSAFLCLTLASNVIGADAARLAIVPADDAMAVAVDVLTVELSRQTNLVLLERAQIETLYREQSLQASQRGDFLRLGQVLGADGVLILELARQGEKQQLGVRLAAVKPGVVLQQRNYPWPLQNLPKWSALVARQFQAMFPKLGVLPRDAVPISLLNLRAAVRSAEAERLEHELTLVLRDRLTLERDLFVLERRELATLAEEKDLKQDTNAPFWNGSYLLEGTIDPEGFTRHEITIHARLVPPGGQAATEIRTLGLRTNLITVADVLAGKILAALRRTNSAPEWKPADEAAQYFTEAKWAMKWGVLKEAQAASDSAWALGKRDLECAAMRVNSYLQSARIYVPYQSGEVINVSGKPQITRYDLQELSNNHPVGLTIELDGLNYKYAYVEKVPDPKTIDRAFHALALHHEFTQTLPPGEPAWDSPWCDLGVQALEASSVVLQHFHFVPQAASDNAGRLADLRALARAACARLAGSSTVSNAFWDVFTQIKPEETPRIPQLLRIFQLQLDSGCLWQETPEDCLALYRELMSKPMFVHLKSSLRQRPPERPLLVAWNATDRNRTREVWEHFLQELEQATNVVARIEGACIRFGNFKGWDGMEARLDSLVNLILSYREVIATNKVNLLNNEWGIELMIRNMEGSTSKPPKEKLLQRHFSEHRPKLQALQQVFQARENDLEKRVRQILDPSVPATNAMTAAPPPWRAPPGQAPPKPERTTNGPTAEVLVVSQFVEFPWQKASSQEILEFFLHSHRWSEGRLWLNWHYFGHFDRDLQQRLGHSGALAGWDPQTQRWEVIPYPEGVLGDRLPEGYRDGDGAPYFEMFDGALYLCVWETLNKYDFAVGRWNTLKVPGHRKTQLSAIHGRLYAGDEESIYEITEGGQGSRLLASCRRRPPVTSLDARESLGKLNLFPGPDQTLRAWVNGGSFEWNGKDWVPAQIPICRRPVTFDGVTALWSNARRGIHELWMLPGGSRPPELAWREQYHDILSTPVGPGETLRAPLWSSSETLALESAPITVSGSNILFFAEHVGVTHPASGPALTERDGRHADLICLDRRSSQPITVPLRFDLDRGQYNSREVGVRRGSALGTHVWLEMTPAALLLGQSGVRGFWVIPRKEIHARLEPVAGKSP